MHNFIFLSYYLGKSIHYTTYYTYFSASPSSKFVPIHNNTHCSKFLFSFFLVQRNQNKSNVMFEVFFKVVTNCNYTFTYLVTGSQSPLPVEAFWRELLL